MAPHERRSDEERDRDPGPGEQTGEAVGGIGGTLAGAGIGSVAGPVGTIIGGLAGALGGWWAGEKAGRALEDMGEHEEHYRTHHDSLDTDVGWEDARIGYAIGHAAGRHPEYRGMDFEAVEPRLRDNWAYDEYGYTQMKPYIREAFGRTSQTPRTGGGGRMRGEQARTSV